MSQTNAKERNSAFQSFDKRYRYSCVIGSSRTWRNHDFIGSQSNDLFYGYLVIPVYLCGCTGLSYILNKVIGKRIIIIYNKNHAEQRLRIK